LTAPAVRGRLWLFGGRAAIKPQPGRIKEKTVKTLANASLWSLSSIELAALDCSRCWLNVKRLDNPVRIKIQVRRARRNRRAGADSAWFWTTY
jgi:hypothetical protein